MNTRRVIELVFFSNILLLAVAGFLLYSFRDEARAWLLALPETPQSGKTVDPLVLSSTDALVTDAISRANPAVVSVIVSKDVPILEQYYEEFGFGFQIPRVRERGTERREVGGGSGFIVSSEGLVITNRHVVADADATYSILLNDGVSHEVTVVARDPVLDIAVLQIEGENGAAYPYLSFGNSDALVLGQSVIAIGNALAEFRNSVSVGVVSGLARSIVAGNGFGMSEALDEVIQTDAAINPGNSGGPLLDLAGQVIGVNVATAIGSENISFALPGNVVKTVVDSVTAYGRIVRPYIGVRHIMLSEAIARSEGLQVTEGALVIEGVDGEPAVVANSPGAQAGLKTGDVIRSINGTALTEHHTLAGAVRSFKVGDTITLSVWRDGTTFDVSVTLTEAPAV